jgi:hypothetical protein
MANLLEMTSIIIMQLQPHQQQYVQSASSSTSKEHVPHALLAIIVIK